MCHIADASKTGVAQETLNNTVRKASKAMTEQEARQILGVSDQTAWEEILKVGIPFSALFILHYEYIVKKITCCRNMMLCLRGMRRMGAFIFSRRFTKPRNV